MDHRRGTVVAVSSDKLRAMQEADRDLRVLIAKAGCKGITKDEIHQLIDEIYESYGGF